MLVTENKGSKPPAYHTIYKSRPPKLKIHLKKANTLIPMIFCFLIRLWCFVNDDLFKAITLCKSFIICLVCGVTFQK